MSKRLPSREIYPMNVVRDHTRSTVRVPQPAIWLSATSAAVRAGVCTKTIKRWINDGYLAAMRTPTAKGKGHLRIRLGDLEALLARGVIQ